MPTSPLVRIRRGCAILAMSSLSALAACGEPAAPAAAAPAAAAAGPAGAIAGVQPPAAAGPTAAAAPPAAEPVVAAAPKPLLPALAERAAELAKADEAAIAEDRRRQLDKLALFIRTKLGSGEGAKLVFICTHNSRRSHMSQLWAAVAAAHYGVAGVETFSGGTEVTAFNPRAVEALRRAGFAIAAGEGENPRYQVSYLEGGPAVEAFSKRYADPPNPTAGFAAVMTCSQADKNCPTVEGASLRVPIPYVDPKEADGQPDEAEVYDARSTQIATEMFYLFRRVAA